MKYLGLDWGMKRIGMAISDGQLASSFGTFEVQNLQQAITKVTEIVHKENIDQVVIGLPEGEMGKNVQRAAGKLTASNIHVELADETLSSKNALQTMITMGASKKARKEDHAMAAMLLLQDYLDTKK